MEVISVMLLNQAVGWNVISVMLLNKAIVWNVISSYAFEQSGWVECDFSYVFE